VITGWIAKAEHLPPVVIGTLALVVGVVVYVLYVAALVHRRRPPEIEIDAQPATKAEPPAPKDLKRLPALEQLYLEDFKKGGRGVFAQVFSDQEMVADDGTKVTIKYQLVLIYPAHARVLAVYVPATPITSIVALHICEKIDEYAAVSEEMRVGSASLEEVAASELVFTGKVYIYHESSLTLADRGKLDAAFRAKKLWLQLRGTSYALERQDAPPAKPSPETTQVEPNEPILKRAAKPVVAEEKRPPLNEAHQGRCKNALIDVANFLKGDLTNLYADLNDAANSENLKELKPYISKFHARTIHAHNAAKKLSDNCWTWLNMMGGLEMKQLVEALSELQKKVAVAKAAVDEGHHEPALMLSVRPMREQNQRVGKLANDLIKAVEEKDAEFFGD
jgi:hypothetical protein